MGIQVSSQDLGEDPRETCLLHPYLRAGPCRGAQGGGQLCTQGPGCHGPSGRRTQALWGTFCYGRPSAGIRQGTRAAGGREAGVREPPRPEAGHPVLTLGGVRALFPPPAWQPWENLGPRRWPLPPGHHGEAELSRSPHVPFPDGRDLGTRRACTVRAAVPVPGTCRSARGDPTQRSPECSTCCVTGRLQAAHPRQGPGRGWGSGVRPGLSRVLKVARPGEVIQQCPPDLTGESGS